MNKYPVKSVVRLSVLFSTIANDTPIDPTTVTLRILHPDGTETDILTADLTHSSTGSYYYDFITLNEGRYRYRWQGDGAIVAATTWKDFYAN